MLVRVTECCDMGCIHCAIDANPEGQHMSLETFDKVILYLSKLCMPIVLITGGEPTKNPNIIDMIIKTIKAGLKPFLLSNGTFLENKELREKIHQTNIPIYITNDIRYYPRRVPFFDHPNYIYEHHLRAIAPFHRAVKNNIPNTIKVPLCFNFRSICTKLRDYQKAILTLRSYGKMCTPSINIDGSISAGESNACSIIGYITDNLHTLLNKVCSMRCDKCKLVYNLTKIQKEAIGELH